MNNKTFSKSLLILLLLFLSTFIYAKPISEPLKQGWFYTLGDKLEWSKPNIDVSLWTEVTLPKLIVLKNMDSWFWLHNDFDIPESLSSNQLWLDTGISNVAFDVYINGIYIGSHGSLPPDYVARSQLNVVIPIPSNLINEGKNCISLRMYSSANSADLGALALCNKEAAKRANYNRNVLNMRLYVIMAALCAFLGMYFFLQFLVRRDNKANLYFTLSLLSVAVYFLDMGAEGVFLSANLQRSLGRGLLPISIGFLVLFFLSYYQDPMYKKIKFFIFGLSLTILIVMLVLTGQEAKANTFFTLCMLPIFAGVVFSFIILFKAYKRKYKFTLPIVIGFGIGVALSMHDVIYQVIGKVPFAWLQGIAFFCLNLSVFISLSLRAAYTQIELDQSSSLLQEQKQSLQNLIIHAEKLSTETSNIAKELDSSVIKVAKDTEQLSSEAESIGGLVNKQTEAITTAQNAVYGLTESLKTVNQEHNLEVNSLKKTAEETQSLISGFTLVGKGINGAAEFSERLTDMMKQGLIDMNKLAKVMENIKESSAQIINVISVVNTFAEQTNLLAMNASIEAAHSGIAGKGFAVIAQEIKKLATGSTEQSDKIEQMVTRIQKAIATGAELSINVKSFMEKIEAESTATSSRVMEAAQGMMKQQSAGELIAQESTALTKSAEKIQTETSRQYEYSNKVNEIMQDLTIAADSVRKAAADIIARNNATAKQADDLKLIASRTKEATEGLRLLMTSNS